MGKKKEKLEKMEQLVDLLHGLSGKEFTGQIKINFSQGGVGRVEKFEEVLREPVR